MSRTFAIPLVALALIIGASGIHIHSAQAQGIDSSGNVIDANGNVQTTSTGGSTTKAGGTTAGTPSSSGSTAAGPSVPTAPHATPDLSSGFAGVMVWIMGLFAWLLGVAIVVLDNTVVYTVVTMGHYVNNLSAIGVAWTVLRDIGNIVLIFGFLAIGITTIIDSDWYGGGVKMLPMLLVAAIFLNFSLFISEAVIDAGNLVATEFYAQINGGSTALPTSISNEPISNAIMNQLGLQTIYNASTNSAVFAAGSTSMIGFMSIILFIVAAFVMFSLAFILIARFVILVFLIIIAPIGFASWAIPQLESTSKWWWNELLRQTFTAPILLLMLYVALQVITNVNFLTGFNANKASAAAWTGSLTAGGLVGFAGIMISFIVAMGLLLFVVILAYRLSAHGANWATKMGGKLSFGTVAWAGRATGGTAGNLLTSRWMMARANGKVGKYVARPLVFAGRGLRSSKYDLRNAPGVGSTLSSLGIDAGKGSSLTPAQIHAAQYGIKPVATSLREGSKEYETAAAAEKRSKVISSGAPADIQKELKKMSEDEIAQLKGIRDGQDRLVQVLSPTAYGNLMKNKNLLASEKAKISSSWDAQFATHAASAAALARMSDDERVALGGKTLSKPEVYENLNADDFDNIRTAKLDPAQKTTIAAYVRGIHSGAIPLPATAPPTLRTDLIAATANPKFKAYYSIP